MLATGWRDDRLFLSDPRDRADPAGLPRPSATPVGPTLHPGGPPPRRWSMEILPTTLPPRASPSRGRRGVPGIFRDRGAPPQGTSLALPSVVPARVPDSRLEVSPC